MLEKEKKKIHEAYDLITEEVLTLRSAESADEQSYHGESWRLINEIIGRKTAKKGIVKTKSRKKESISGIPTSKDS